MPDQAGSEESIGKQSMTDKLGYCRVTPTAGPPSRHRPAGTRQRRRVNLPNACDLDRPHLLSAMKGSLQLVNKL